VVNGHFEKLKSLVANRNYFVTGGPEKYIFSLMEHMPQHQFVPFSVDFEKNARRRTGSILSRPRRVPAVSIYA
jgi:hypothetical protein